MRWLWVVLAVVAVGCGKKESFVEAEAIYQDEVKQLKAIEDEYRLFDDEAIERQWRELNKKFRDEEKPAFLAGWNKAHGVSDEDLTDSQRLERDVEFIKAESALRAKYDASVDDGGFMNEERLALKAKYKEKYREQKKVIEAAEERKRAAKK